MLRWMILLTLSVVVVVSPALAGWKDDYRKAVNRGDRQGALQVVQSAVKAGEAEAEFTLGLLYYAGQGVARDEEEAYARMSLGIANGFSKGGASLKFVEEKMSKGQLSRAKGRVEQLQKERGPSR